MNMFSSSSVSLPLCSPSLTVRHDAGHLLLELLFPCFHQLPVFLHDLGLALDGGAFDLGLLQLVDGAVGLLLSHEQGRVGRCCPVFAACGYGLDDIVNCSN